MPDDPIATHTRLTTVTVPGSRPTVVTTYITFLTPSPTAPAAGQTTVIGGLTFTLVPDPTYGGDVVPQAKRTASPTTLQLRRKEKADD